MKPEQQRIVIAEWCGWKLNDEDIVTPDGEVIDCEFLCEEAVDASWPDYIKDLNAMHTAEKHLGALMRTKYRDELCGVCALECTGPMSEWWNATAAQRAEALLRTIGKWED